MVNLNLERTMKQSKRLTIPMTKRHVERHDFPNGGFSESYRRLPDGTLTGTVTIHIDVEALVEMYGERALRNRGKRATGAHGYIKAYASNLSREGGTA